MKKVIISTLLLIMSISTVGTVTANASSMEQKESNVCAQEHLEEESIEHNNECYGQERIAPAIWWLIEQGIFTAVNSTIVTEHWIKHNRTGYNKYVLDYNNGRYHCYNMCSLHNSFSPSKYGLTSAILNLKCC